jgi:alkanesulfonate monooxygenase SsuD/methylene tetrahydromethanopterin reductase-like flavin-dependent oxidoreductase (luciferase family)
MMVSPPSADYDELMAIIAKHEASAEREDETLQSAKEKRAMALEAAEQIANLMVLEPYPGFAGKYFTMPCRNVLPKPVQMPNPPMWMACTNREAIKIAVQNGVGALAFSFLVMGIP